jgi:hypothetical protein
MRPYSPIIVFALMSFLVPLANGQCNSSTRPYSNRGETSIRKPLVVAHRLAEVSQFSVAKLAVQSSEQLPTQQAQRQPSPQITPAPIASTKARSINEIQSVENGEALNLAVKTGEYAQGMAILSINGVTMLLEPEKWQSDSVLIQMPRFLIEKPTSVKLFVAANPETLLAKLEFVIQP